jgi:hypothetical protein
VRLDGHLCGARASPISVAIDYTTVSRFLRRRLADCRTNASVVRLAGVSIFSNAVNGLVVGTNGSIISFGNNYNSGNGAPTSTIAPQ